MEWFRYRFSRSEHKRRETTTARLMAMLLAGLLLGLASGCAIRSNAERVFFHADINALATMAAGPADGIVTQDIEASVSRVAMAAKSVLQQRALVFFASRDNSGGIEYRYLDRTSFRFENAARPVEMVFQMKLIPTAAERSQLQIVCHWDTMIDDEYRKNQQPRFGALRTAMLSEAVLMADRVRRQSDQTATSTTALVKETQ